MSSNDCGSIAYSSGGRPATAFSPMFGSSAPMNCHTSMPALLAHELRRDVGVLLREPALEEVGRFDGVVVDADENEVFEAHWCLPVRMEPAPRRPWLRWSGAVYDRRGDRSHVDGVRAQGFERAPLGGGRVRGREIHGGATPASNASCQRDAQRHQRSPGARPGKPNSGRGVTGRCPPRSRTRGTRRSSPRTRGAHRRPRRPCRNSRPGRSRSAGRSRRARARPRARSVPGDGERGRRAEDRAGDGRGLDVGVEAQAREPVEELRRPRRASPCARGADRGTCAGPTRTRGAGAAAGKCRTPRGCPSTFSSWFAEPMLTAIVEPAVTRTPSTSVSRVAVRMMPMSGGSHRRPSSIACGSRVRSARSASSWSGFESRPNSRFDDERYVVSAPAGSSRRRNEQISSSVRRTPSSSACASTEITSSEGCLATLGDDARRSSRTALATPGPRGRGRSRR